MPFDITRRFLVHTDRFTPPQRGISIRSGCISTDSACPVIVCIQDGEASLRIGGAARGAGFDYPVPASDAEAMQARLCTLPILRKRRFYCAHDGVVWEVDQFEEENEGLVVASIDLDEDETVALPAWIGAEVTGDARYCDLALIGLPYSRWQPPHRESRALGDALGAGARACVDAV